MAEKHRSLCTLADSACTTALINQVRNANGNLPPSSSIEQEQYLTRMLQKLAAPFAVYLKYKTAADEAMMFLRKRMVTRNVYGYILDAILAADPELGSGVERSDPGRIPNTERMCALAVMDFKSLFDHLTRYAANNSKEELIEMLERLMKAYFDEPKKKHLPSDVVGNEPNRVVDSNQR